MIIVPFANLGHGAVKKQKAIEDSIARNNDNKTIFFVSKFLFINMLIKYNKKNIVENNNRITEPIPQFFKVNGNNNRFIIM